ncbi:uncharacterized protein LOC143920711 [Arctopsyche grandis]|uniref:uncharacterized protein LOC143920711 n=1 Tax=Arctopsyche grandis TaxID=121162 RepID=UPI00406D9DCF
MDKYFKQFWNTTNAILVVKNSIPVHVNDIYNHRSVANMFSKHFNESGSDLIDVAVVVLSNSEDSSCVITGDEIETALRTMYGGKATGWDSISTDHVLHGGKNFFVILARLFNLMIIHEHVPEEFSRTTIVPVLKSSKLDALAIDNYRPIAISTILSRTLENIIFSGRLSGYPLSADEQYGFTRGSLRWIWPSTP